MKELELTEQTFEDFASIHYNNPNCTSILEFFDDLKTIKYIKRLINQYAQKGILKERLILNHIIALNNVFEPYVTVKILRFKIDDENHDVLNAFLLYLNYIEIETTDVLDLNLYLRLEKNV